MKITVTVVKSWLRQYHEYEVEIENQMERIERLKSKLEGVGAQEITDMPTSHSGEADRFTDLIAKKNEIEESISGTVKKQRFERERIESALSKSGDAIERAIIRHRYIDGLNWESVNRCIFGKQKDFEEKEDSYKRRLFMYHGDALKHLTETVNKDSRFIDLAKNGRT